jgi:hypothetical protein
MVVGGYLWLFMVIILVDIGVYSILMAISGYFINSYQWLFY